MAYVAGVDEYRLVKKRFEDAGDTRVMGEGVEAAQPQNVVVESSVDGSFFAFGKQDPIPSARFLRIRTQATFLGPPLRRSIILNLPSLRLPARLCPHHAGVSKLALQPSFGALEQRLFFVSN